MRSRFVGEQESHHQGMGEPDFDAVDEAVPCAFENGEDVMVGGTDMSDVWDRKRGRDVLEQERLEGHVGQTPMSRRVKRAVFPTTWFQSAELS